MPPRTRLRNHSNSVAADRPVPRMELRAGAAPRPHCFQSVDLGRLARVSTRWTGSAHRWRIRIGRWHRGNRGYAPGNRNSCETVAFGVQCLGIAFKRRRQVAALRRRRYCYMMYRHTQFGAIMLVALGAPIILLLPLALILPPPASIIVIATAVVIA